MPADIIQQFFQRKADPQHIIMSHTRLIHPVLCGFRGSIDSLFIQTDIQLFLILSHSYPL
jgi:hypothetical protein